MIEGQYVQLREEGLLRDGAKTNLYTVQSKGSYTILGEIHWYAQWRKYCYYTLPNFPVVLDQTCLREIASFCEQLTSKHKNS